MLNCFEVFRKSKKTGISLSLPLEGHGFSEDITKKSTPWARLSTKLVR